MGRPAEGVRVTWKRGWAYARFRWQGQDHRVALGTRDAREAATSAARAYSDVVSGRIATTARRPGQLLALDELLAEWIEWKRPALDVETAKTLDVYARKFLGYFGSLDRITEANAASYGMTRLGQAMRTTVLRELAYLRQFLAWCKQQGSLAAVPLVPTLPPKARGKRTGTQRAKAVDITPAEALAIIAALPEQSKKIGDRKWPIRARFAFAWETTLRPASVAALSVPEHWRPGLRALELPDDDDKARFGRTLDLTPAAVATLKACVPPGGAGLVFGAHSFAKAIKRAARAVLGAERAEDFAPYDFRHGRAKALLDAGAPLRGVSYLLGHKRPSTTDRYLAPDRRAGAAALAAVSAPFLPPKKKVPQKAG